MENGEQGGASREVDSREGGAHPTREELVRLRRRLEAAVSRTCPAWLADRAEDIVQNAMLQLVEKLRRSEGTRTFSSIYLQKAAYGATVDEIRRACRRRETSANEAIAGHAATDPGPAQAASSRELARAIRGCLGAMRDARRLAVTLYLQGCSVPEIGRRLGWGRKRAENLVYRGLADLRGCLRKKGWTP